MKFFHCRSWYLALLIFVPIFWSCTDTNTATAQQNAATKEAAAAFPETFEQGAKRSYMAGDVQLASGSWHLDNALIGKTEADAKHDGASLRIAAGGTVTTLFKIQSAINSLSFYYATYGKGSHSSTISLWYELDGDTTWHQLGASINATGNDLTVANFQPDWKGAQSVSFSIHNDGDERVNIDDFDLKASNGITVKRQENNTGNSAGNQPTRDDNMALGNPSDATANESNRNNYLLVHPQYTLSYNNDKGMANWVSWHLSLAWRGDAKRCNCFMSDNDLPNSFFKALTSNYIATGFDRGHLCPSDDRTASADENAGTFLMSNMSPQAPWLNQQTWEHLESYSRTLTDQGNELYIIAGGYGQGGSGSKGGMTNTIANGSINVPSHFWKIIVVLPVGSNDIHRITAATRIIAVNMPNLQSVNEHDWDYYRTSVKAIEQATGYHFFSKIPVAINKNLKNKTDNGPVE